MICTQKLKVLPVVFCFIIFGKLNFKYFLFQDSVRSIFFLRMKISCETEIYIPKNFDLLLGDLLTF